MIILYAAIIISCNKTDFSSKVCPPADTFALTSNSPVIAGWPLTVTISNSQSWSFKWWGPKGTITRGSDPYTITIPAAAYSDSGMYYAKLTDDNGCILTFESTRVNVVGSPTVPCSVANNTSISSVSGVGGTTYTSISGYASGGTYYVDASDGYETMEFRFNGNNPPIPGVYATTGYFPTDNVSAGMLINNGFYDFMNNTGPVYVTNENGKTILSFCRCSFSNPISGTPITISARITIP